MIARLIYVIATALLILIIGAYTAYKLYKSIGGDVDGNVIVVLFTVAIAGLTGFLIFAVTVIINLLIPWIING